MEIQGLFSQSFSQHPGAFEDATITATQLGSQVDFSFLDFNTQTQADGGGFAGYPEFKDFGQARAHGRA